MGDRPGSKQPGDGLRGVERAATTDPDHDVGGTGAAGRDGVVDQLWRRFTVDREVIPGDPGRVQPAGEFRPCASGLERAGAGHQQGSPAMGGDQRRDVGSPARAKDDPRQACDGERRCCPGQKPKVRPDRAGRLARWSHGDLLQLCVLGVSSISTASQRSPCRGSAIIGATRSRQPR